MAARPVPASPDAEIEGVALRAGLAEGRLTWVGSTAVGAIRYVPLAASNVSQGPGVAGWVLEADTAEPLPSSWSGPVVGGIEPDLVREGEEVELDGGRGLLTLHGVARHDVVTAFLERSDGRILVLLRSARVGSFRGHWAGVSGFLEEKTPEAQAYREILEETGVTPSALTLATRGRVVFARDGDRVFAIHPFRFRVQTVNIRLDWEHTEFAWVRPEELAQRRIVPKLERVWAEVAAPGPGGRSEGND
jgi:8-oxo-dGTP diphosphatase